MKIEDLRNIPEPKNTSSENRRFGLTESILDLLRLIAPAKAELDMSSVIPKDQKRYSLYYDEVREDFTAATERR